MAPVTRSEAWKALTAHHQQIAAKPMREMFAEDPARSESFSLAFEDILLDYSKNRVNAETMSLLFELAAQADLSGWTSRLFGGDRRRRSDPVARGPNDRPRSCGSAAGDGFGGP